MSAPTLRPPAPTPTGGRRTPGPARKPRKRSGNGSKHLVLGLFAVVSLAPLVLVVSTAFKNAADVRRDPFGLFTSVSLDNVISAWTEGNFGEYFWNSVLLTVPSTLLVVLLSAAAGYAFARCRFPGRDLLFYLIILALLVPPFTIMVPLFFQLRSMGLLDTLVGAVLVLTSTGLAFGTFLMRSFFLDLPRELEEAGRIDGASEWQIFWRIMLPLVQPAGAALAVFTFVQNWNNFIVPLLYLPSGQYRPLTAGLYLFASGRTQEIGPLAAGALITVLPVIAVFVVAQRQLIRGFVSGAVKG
jgi:raffinose/stachyose/melibiose transport system permease protein